MSKRDKSAPAGKRTHLSPDDKALLSGGGIRPLDDTITVVGHPPPIVSPPPIIVSPPSPPPPSGGSSPPPPPINPNCSTPTRTVQNSFITQKEGGIVTDGYVPTDDSGNPAGNSGVTIGAGIDLGSKTATSLQAMGLPSSITDQLTPYYGLTGTAAQQALAQQPLTMSSADATTLTTAVQNTTINNLASTYDDATSFGSFDNLPSDTQTAIADLAYQYGDGTSLAKRTPTFWEQITSGEWQDAVDNLNNFGDAYTTRRQDEAKLMQDDINQYTMPSPANPCK